MCEQISDGKKSVTSSPDPNPVRVRVLILSQNQYIRSVQELGTIEAQTGFFCFAKDLKTSCLQLPVKKNILLLPRLFIESAFAGFHL